jgi:ABC-type siderophore export system fused ATPase/permease subunit
LFTTIFADYYLVGDVVQGDQPIPEDASTYLKAGLLAKATFQPLLMLPGT